MKDLIQNSVKSGLAYNIKRILIFPWKMLMAGSLGFEPRTSGSAGRCHNPYYDDEPNNKFMTQKMRTS